MLAIFVSIFLWIPSHIGLHPNDTVDRLAKEACRLPDHGDGRPLSLPCYLTRVRSAAFLPEQRRRDTERPYSVTIRHYESVCRTKYTYRRRGLMVRRHQGVKTRGGTVHPPFSTYCACDVTIWKREREG